MKAICLTIMVTLALISCYRPAQVVVQGQCVAYDESNHLCYLDDERTPKKERIQIETGSALMGRAPVSGEWLRISYIEKDNRKKALRIMNFNAQKNLLADVGIKLTDKGPRKIR